MHQPISTGRRNAQHLRHHLRIEEQRQITVVFELGYFHIVAFLSFCCWPRTVHLPAPGRLRRFHSVGTLTPSMEVLALLLPGSMNSGGGYSVVKVQLTKLILFFCIQFSILRFQLNIPLDIRQ